MPVLVLPPRYTQDTIALRRAALAAGWEVERLSGWRAPPDLAGRDAVLYGEPLFAAAVAGPLGVALVEPPPDWLPTIPARYRHREVVLTTLAAARDLAVPRFVKPGADKCFAARVYDTGADLPLLDAIPDDTPVLVAEPVCWDVEFRCFVLDRVVRTTSPYWRDGKSAEDAAGDWTDPWTEAAEAFAAVVLADPAVALPPAVVVDVGVIAGRGWAVVEANAAWGSGIYGCDAAEVLAVVRRSCVPSANIGHEDRHWVAGEPAGARDTGRGIG
jgi:hypothetical protein